MKKLRLQIKKHQMRYMYISVLMLILCPLLANAQDGQNDASFNTADHVSGQGANGIIRVSAVQSDNKIIISGSFSTYNGKTANGLARLKMDGKRDKSFNAGTGVDGMINSIAIQSSNDKAIIAGDFSSYDGNIANKIARLNANGSIDNTFVAGVGANDAISQVLLQPNGKLLIAGAFTYYDGDSVRGVVRLNRNGTVDATFDAVIPDSLQTIQQIALQPDGKIIVAARSYNSDYNMYYYSIIRLNSDGSRDYSFMMAGRYTGDLRPKISAIQVEGDGNILASIAIYDGSSSVPYHGFLTRLDTSGNEILLQGLFWINSLHLLSDGKIIAAGYEDLDWYDVEKRVVRLNTDLTIDSSFLFKDNKAYPSKADADVETIAYQIDGKMVIAGDFYELNGVISNNIARLNPDGGYDHTFNQHTGFNGTVLATAVYNNKRLYVGGEFSRYNYLFRSNIVRLKENGDLDASFNVGTGTNGKVNTIAIQSNGKVLIGGDFTSYNGTACNYVARLNTDGSLDTNFDIHADAQVRKIIIDKDGRIIIAGDFENINGASRAAIVRIRTNGSVDTTFNPTIDAYGKGYDCKISSRGKIYLAVIYEDGLYSFGTDIYCLNKNGTRDLSFNIPTGDFYKIDVLAFNNDNKLLAGGLVLYSDHFSNYAGVVARFNSDGSIDSTFRLGDVSNSINKMVRTIEVLENDRIVIGGDFTANEYAPFDHIGLLNSDGTTNTDFAGSAGNSVYTTTSVRNDKLIVGGAFSEYASVVRNGIARINIAESVMERRSRALAASQQANEPQLIAYPNPATSAITLDNLAIGSTFRIFNAIGKEVYSEVVTATKSTLELSAYSNGIYFIVVENSKEKSTSKFIVNR